MPQLNIEQRYFFRDLEHCKNSDGAKSYHAAGVVVAFFSPIGSPCFSGKDVSIRALHPFNGWVESAWRSFGEIELFEAEQYDYEQALAALDAVEKASAK